MTSKPAEAGPPERDAADALKGWAMLGLTALFVGLYVAALGGWLRPLADERMVTRLEPIIFVIIGYYFGRLPARENEKTLKDEIVRQTLRADTASHAKEQAQQTREALEERVKNARAALTPAASARSPAEGAGAAGAADPTRASIAAALNILDS